MVGKTDPTPAPRQPSKPDPEMFETSGVQLRHPPHPHAGGGFLSDAGLRHPDGGPAPRQEQEDDMCYEGGIREFATSFTGTRTLSTAT